MKVSLVVPVITYLIDDRKAPFFTYKPDYKII